MASKKEQERLAQLKKDVPIDQLTVLEDQYYAKLDTDPKYSINVDPQNHYNMSDTQKEFVANYVQFKNVPLAAKLTGIDEETALDYFNQYSTKMEIRRINLALYHRAFATKMLGWDEIGGWLTSVIMGENIAEGDKIGTRDKMQAAKLLMEINKMKQESIANPDSIIDYNIQDQLDDLSADTIKLMLEAKKKSKNLGNESENSVNEEFAKIYSDTSEDDIKQKRVAQELLKVNESKKNDNKLMDKISRFMQGNEDGNNSKEENLFQEEEEALKAKELEEDDEEEEEENYDD